MQRYVLGRLVQGAITLLAMTAVVFMLTRLSGNPINVMLPLEATDQDRALLSKQLGLDQPLPMQYVVYHMHAAKGDFGTSLFQRRPAMQIVMERFPATAELGVTSILFSLIIAVPLGILSATRRDGLIDRFGKSIALLGQSVPLFWLGILLVLIFAVDLRLVPSSGRSGFGSYILPTIATGWYVLAGIMRILRSSMLDTLDSEYVKLVRAKGMPEYVVVLKHALRNATIPVLTFTATIFGALLAGSVVTETVFAWPGVGQLAVQSFMSRDFPVVQAVVLLFSAITIAINLAVDVLYAYVDPRIRY